MEKSILKDLQAYPILDLTKSNYGFYNKFDLYISRIISSGKNAICILDYIYPLKKLSSNIYQISDHVNLSGFNPLIGPQFIQLNNIYLTKSKLPKIIVAGLKEGTIPTKKEGKVLLKSKVNAYCYNLIPAVILAASKGLKVYALGLVASSNQYLT